MNTTKQKGFAIVNIVMGVILTLGSFFAFADPAIGAGGLITLALGLALWITGAKMLSALRKFADNTELIRKTARVNTVFFIVSCVVIGASVILPIVAPVL